MRRSAPEEKAYAIRENDGASLSMGHFKRTETLLPLLVIRRPIAAMIVADETDGLVVADDAPRQDAGIGRTSVGLGERRCRSGGQHDGGENNRTGKFYLAPLCGACAPPSPEIQFLSIHG